jgi:hypothetical protein
MMGFLKMQSEKSKRRSRLYVLLSLTAVLGIGGVVAATSITINSGSPISLGAGYSTATSCDEAVTVSAGQGYDVTDNIYKVNSLEVSAINLWLATNSTGNGCGLKTLQLSWVATSGAGGAATSTSWVLPSSSLTTQIFRFGSTANTISSNYYNASAALTSFSIANLSTIAISIS